MKNKEFVKKVIHEKQFQSTILRCDDIFLQDELSLFDTVDASKIWVPDGIPFLGEFDMYLKVFNREIFQGFFRIEVFPWDEIHLHIAFPTSQSLKSRYYLKVTSFFLFLLKDLESKFDIFCMVNKKNKNVLRYMDYFDFKYIGEKNGTLEYQFEKLKNTMLYKH